MALYALGTSFVVGWLRWPVWSLPLLIVAFIIATLGMGSDWDPNVWRPFNNPILIDLLLKLALINAIACTLGYLVGRLVAFVWRRLMGGSSIAAPPAGPTSRR